MRKRHHNAYSVKPIQKKTRNEWACGTRDYSQGTKDETQQSNIHTNDNVSMHRATTFTCCSSPISYTHSVYLNICQCFLFFLSGAYAMYVSCLTLCVVFCLIFFQFHWITCFPFHCIVIDIKCLPDSVNISIYSWLTSTISW